jgi:hypothetical protein
VSKATGAATAQELEQHARNLRDVEVAENEELNMVLGAYLEKRTGVLDELMRRELWQVRERGKEQRQAIQHLLQQRRQQTE